MAASRKLQGEIDRCLKKVTEGVETFDDIWTKVLHAVNSNQKEKHEADLKKEIKKLQRLRDQIKTWQTSAEVKDKTSLIEHRKLIETQMERFKGLERETKTKAYSKEGLGAAVKLDPAQKERDECNRWLTASIEQLNVQIDQFEAEVDGLAAKKKRDRDKTERLDSLKHWIERHRFHIKKLETLMRMLDNNAVDVEAVKKIHDDVEYYTESNQEPDFDENEYIYCDINMENIEEVGMSENVRCTGDDQSETTNSLHSANSPSPLNVNAAGSSHHHPAGHHSATEPSSGQDDSKRSRRSISEEAPSQKTSKHSNKQSSSSTANHSSSASSTVSVLTSFSSSSSTTAVHTPLIKSTSRSSTASAPDLAHDTPLMSPLGTSSAPNFAAVAAATSHSVSSVHHLSTQQPLSSGSTVSTPSTCSHTTVSSSSPSPVVSVVTSNPNPNSISSTSAPADSAAVVASDVTMVTRDAGSVRQHLQQSQQHLQPHINGGEKSVDPAIVGKSQLSQNSTEVQHRSTINVSPVQSAKPTTEAHIPTLYSVAPLGPVPMTKEHEYQFQMLQSAFYHMPHPSDSERLRNYLPRNPYPTPPYLPQVPPSGSDTLEFFMKLSVETLFFIFYYMEGTKAQYLAAKSLKKQAWRFHTKYMMWFQRHEEPKLITDEFEQGTYIFFDFEKWSQRRKEGFKFEYKFLEDRDLT